MSQSAPPNQAAALQAGLALFQSGSPYAAHETWEAVWLQLPESPLREGVRGLIQLAVAAAHLQRDPSRRARLAGLLRRADQRLADPAVRLALQQAGLGAVLIANFARESARGNSVDVAILQAIGALVDATALTGGN